MLNNGNLRQEPVEYGASYRSVVSLAANTAEVVFSAASNIKGAILHKAQFVNVNALGSSAAYLAKSSAPANTSDGDAILTADFIGFITANYITGGALDGGVFIPAGKGVYFIDSVAQAAGQSTRAALFTLLT